MEMTLEQYNKYLKEEELGFININKHPENENIVILNYTELATFERRWNNETMSSRGLILDTTNATNNGMVKVLAKPFDKFFNYGENADYENDIDFDEVESVMEKMDGSLGISYLFDGEIRFATRGSFTSEQALYATNLWKTKYKDANSKYFKMFPFSKPTLLVEIIYPENRVVVDYKGEEKLVLLGLMFQGIDCTYHMLKQVAMYMRLPIANMYHYNIDELVKMKKEISANEEGWIVKFKCGKRLKIKGDEYMQVHRIKHGMSTKAKYKAWSEDRLQEYIMMLPEEFRPELENFEKNLDTIKNARMNLFQNFYDDNLKHIKEQRDFAFAVNKLIENKTLKKFMFEARKNNHTVKEKMLKEHIYKNYKDYEENGALFHG